MKGMDMLFANGLNKLGFNPDEIISQVKDMAGLITSMKLTGDRSEAMLLAFDMRLTALKAQQTRIEGKQDLILALLQKEKTNA